MSQQAVQLTLPERLPDSAMFDPNPRASEPDARFSEIRALSPARAPGVELRPLWFESACLGGVLSLTLASQWLLTLDWGARANLIASLACCALSCAVIAAGLSRARRFNVLCLVVLSLAAMVLVWFAVAATADSLEAQPARDAFEATLR